MQRCECRLTNRVGVALSREGNDVAIKLWVVMHNTAHQTLRTAPHLDVYPYQWPHIVENTQGSVDVLEVVWDSTEVYTFFTNLASGTAHTTKPLLMNVYNFATTGFLTLPTHDSGVDKGVLF